MAATARIRVVFLATWGITVWSMAVGRPWGVLLLYSANDSHLHNKNVVRRLRRSMVVNGTQKQGHKQGATGTMGSARTVAENGSFRLIEQDGRFAVLEIRDGRAYGLDSESQDSGNEERPSAPDRPDTVGSVVQPQDWTDEPTARRLFDSIIQQGDRLARTIW